MKIILLTLALSVLPASAAVRLISEAELLTWSQDQSPQLDEIKASLLGVQTQRSQLEEKYGAEIFGRATYAETNERPIIAFIPIFSPTKTGQVGIRKNFSKGVEASLSAATQQQSANSAVAGRYRNVTVNILSFTAQVDLWRDLFGRISDSERQNARLETERSKLENEIKTRVFQISLRRIYWSLVATDEQLKIADRLKLSAVRQLKESKDRLRNSIGDAGEVARYQAQLASRTSQIIFFNYQKENLLKQLKNMLPNLGTDDVALSAYDIDQTIGQVLECSNVITHEASTPYKYTKYDEMLTLIREIKGNQKTINQRYSDVDVKFFGTVKSTGVGSDPITRGYQGSYGSAYDDMKNNNRTGYEAGVNVIIPLGDAKENTQKTKTAYDEKRLKAFIDMTESNVVSTHNQLAKSMTLIQEVISNERIATSALEKRLSVVMKKYDQARISVNDLILDQDALLNSQLSTIDAQLQAVNLLLDYLAVFTDTPCRFNGV